MTSRSLLLFHIRIMGFLEIINRWTNFGRIYKLQKKVFTIEEKEGNISPW